MMLLCTMAFAEAQQESAIDHELQGYASWYAGKFQGRLTANGERFDTNELTAAHKTLPFNTIVEVLHIENGRTVTVRINDRGPFVEGRVIDLSRAAAERLMMTAEGIAPVELTIIEEPVLLFTVQIASFSTRDNASRLASSLQANGVPVSLEQAGAVTRVIVPDLEAGEVSAIEEKLADLGYADPLVREQRE
jgi:rare lipoprotein A